MPARRARASRVGDRASGDAEVRVTGLLVARWRQLTPGERGCLGGFALALLAWAAMPPIAQDQAYHAFADRRTLFGIPNAANILSNAAFVLVGGFGVARLASANRAGFPSATQAGLWCVALGLVGAGIGSAWYHADPNDTTLAWDRLPMTLVFAGVLGAALAQRVGRTVGGIALALLAALGVASVVHWRLTGDLSLYAAIQYGGAAALGALLLATGNRGDPFRWWWVLGWYALAKAFEVADGAIWQATGGLVAGHVLKHLAAAVAGATLFLPLRTGTSRRGDRPDAR